MFRLQVEKCGWGEGGRPSQRKGHRVAVCWTQTYQQCLLITPTKVPAVTVALQRRRGAGRVPHFFPGWAGCLPLPRWPPS